MLRWLRRTGRPIAWLPLLGVLTLALGLFPAGPVVAASLPDACGQAEVHCTAQSIVPSACATETPCDPAGDCDEPHSHHCCHATPVLVWALLDSQTALVALRYSALVLRPNLLHDRLAALTPFHPPQP